MEPGDPDVTERREVDLMAGLVNQSKDLGASVWCEGFEAGTDGAERTLVTDEEVPIDVGRRPVRTSGTLELEPITQPRLAGPASRVARCRRARRSRW